MKPDQLEQTLVLIKPDALKNSVTGFILSQLSEFHTGSRFAAAKIVNVNRMLAEQHYAEHQGKPFFEALVEYITGKTHYPEDAWKRRVIAFIYLGEDVLKTVRAMAGPTNPHNAREEKPGCVRALGTVVPIFNEKGVMISDRLDNLIHTSANPEDAEREIKLWFVPNDIPPLMRGYPTVVCQEHYYYKDDQLYTTFEPDSISLLAPGDVVWASDMEILRNHKNDDSTQNQLAQVAAKYLINRIAQD